MRTRSNFDGTLVQPAGAPHRLDALLAPHSIAVVGASTKTNTPGNTVMKTARESGYTGQFYPVNPNYDEVEGFRCYPALDALPTQVDLAVLSVANARLEAAVEAGLASGARAMLIFASGLIEDEAEGALRERVAARLQAAGVPLCGGNCMGFYNLDHSLRVGAFQSRPDMRQGGIALIAQSGSVFGALAHNDRRFGFNLVVSSGGEWVTTAADYLDWVLEQPSTRVVGMFLESVRNPIGFVAALEKARERDIPVVVLKVGRTPASAAMALSHTGALAGSDAAYQAMFERYNVRVVETQDELAATLLLLGHDRRPGTGGLGAMHDSGGERELLADINAKIGVPFAAISERTREELARHLDFGLVPMNPLDGWGTGRDTVGQFAALMGALLDDEDTALGVLFANMRDGYHLSDEYLIALQKAARTRTKPVLIATNFSLLMNKEIALRATLSGIPVLEGTEEALKAIRHALAFRDQARVPPVRLCPVADAVRTSIRARVAAGPLQGAEALEVLNAYGIPTPRHVIAYSHQDAASAARDIGFPVALKTAAGIAHKTEVDGVLLGLQNEEAVVSGYRDLARCLGPAVLVQAMSLPGIEISIGTVNDPSFGPYLMLAAGGVLVEILDDTAIGLAPLNIEEVQALITRLKSSRLLSGVRGGPPSDVAALADCASRLSWLAYDLREFVAEIELNPVIVRADGCLAVDALFVQQDKGGTA